MDSAPRSGEVEMCLADGDDPPLLLFNNWRISSLFCVGEHEDGRGLTPRPWLSIVDE